MYLSEVHLVNWRSYRDARFKFRAPTKRRPLVLIGAMNGHGKTSFLLSLYLGLFGRFGLRHAEGFSTTNADDLSYYRGAISRFRRNSTDANEPTIIDLTFSPNREEEEAGESEVRVVRRWFFAGNGRPRQGDNFEEVDLHVNGKPRRLSDPDAAAGAIERYLFPANFMPAFIFDGEQAQTLINTAGNGGIKKSVEVLFGTKVLEEVGERIRQYITQSRNRIGGKRDVSEKQRELDEKLAERDHLKSEITATKRQVTRAAQRHAELEGERQALNEKLVRLGGATQEKISELQAQCLRAEQEVVAAEEALLEQALRMGPALAVSRLLLSMLNRLKAEEIREGWEGLQAGTLSRADDVLRVAMPEPPEADELLGHLAAEIRQRVKERFRRALAQIYQPPPDGCATEYRFGHVTGEARQRLVASLGRVGNTTCSGVQETARRLAQAKEHKLDLDARRDRFANLPAEVQQMADRLKEIDAEISECTRQLGGFERELRAKQGALDSLNAAIGQLQEKLASLGPDQTRIAVAERVSNAVSSVCEQLRPLSLRQMEQYITNHFTSIADRRFRKGRIEFNGDSSPLLRVPGEPDHFIEVMSGFERRSFGIAFSLALAELTRRRIPLVIDTPMGNADTEYRPRLLTALTEVDMDQIIVLTHDAEMTPDLLEVVRSQLQQTFLVEYDQNLRESVVRDDTFFGGARI